MLSAPPPTTQYICEQTSTATIGTDSVSVDLETGKSGTIVGSTAKDAEVQVGRTLRKKNARVQVRPKCFTKG